jgi:hypothetical protein
MVYGDSTHAMDMMYKVLLRMHNILLFAVLLLAVPLVRAQIPDSEGLVQLESTGGLDGLQHFMRSGTFAVHLRSVGMATVNQGALSDYNTLAVGGGVGYYSADFKGFRFGLSGFLSSQVFENNIRQRDPITGGGNRYEITLYDITDIEHTSNLGRLEDLYIAYRKKGFDVTFGRQRVNTPLLNEQDNRMRHNQFSGLTLAYQQKRWKAMAGLYSQVMIRGTVDWFTIEESLGVYPVGQNAQGSPSGYHNNINSKGVGVLGLTYTSAEQIKIQAWNYTADRVFNLTMLQADGSLKWKRAKWVLGLQGIYQTAIKNGGNPELEMSYMDPNSRGLALGARMGYATKQDKIHLNFLRIDAGGRFLFPREWGREQLYVSLPRERHEGNGDVNALTLTHKHQFKKHSNVQVETGVGAVQNPDTDNHALNKYGLPSYYHFIAAAQYTFKGYLKGLDAKALVLNKTAIYPEEVPDKLRINRVDLWHFDLVMNYRF